MPTPTNRVPVRVARGYLSTLSASISDLYEGELVYALDQQALYAVDAQQLVPVAGTSITSVNGATGSVVLGVGELDDTNVSSLLDGDTLVYSSGEWINLPATNGGTVLSIDLNGSGGVETSGGPVTSSGVIEVSLSSTGVTAGEYTFPTLTVDEKGRITAILSNSAPNQDLDDLSNVNAPTPGIGDGIVWDGVNWINTPDIGGGAETLNELSDVDVSTQTPTEGQALVWDNVQAIWKPGTVATEEPPLSLTDITDVEVTNEADKELLGYDPATGLWSNGSLESIILEDPSELENGDGLVWDDWNNVWLPGKPGSTGKIEYQTYTTTTAQSPLIGGDSLLASDTDWEDLGFILFEEFDSNTNWQEGVQQFVLDLGTLGSPDLFAFHGAVPYGGSDGDNRWTNLGPLDAGVFVTIKRETFAIYHTGETVNTTNPTVTGDPYSFSDDADDKAAFECSIFPQDAKDLEMLVHQAGVIPSYTDSIGEKWTIFRRELTEKYNFFNNWATELWISSKGAVFIKQGSPSWVYSWTAPTGGHGVSAATQLGLTSYALGPVGYGDGTWENLPESGNYVAFAGHRLLAPEKDQISLDDLDDVEVSGVQVNQSLKWSGTQWAPGFTSIDELSDVDTSTSQPTTGQILQWDGSNWVPIEIPVSGATSLDELSDVRTTEPIAQDTNVLAYNYSENRWQPAKPRATPGAPLSLSSPGLPGEMRFNDDHFYICVGLNHWKQIDLIDIEIDPSIGETVDAGNWTDGTSASIDTTLDGGDWGDGTTNDAQGTNADGGIFASTIAGGSFTDGTGGGYDVLSDGGNFTTGASGTDRTSDGGVFTP